MLPQHLMIFLMKKRRQAHYFLCDPSVTHRKVPDREFEFWLHFFGLCPHCKQQLSMTTKVCNTRKSKKEQ